MRVLASLTQALSTLALYGEGHPATTRAAETAHRHLTDLQQSTPHLEFTFLPGEVLFGRDLLPELENWEWSNRLAQAGIERLEVIGPVEPDHLQRFLGHAAAVLGLRADERADLWQAGPSTIRFGRVRVGGTDQHIAAEPHTIATLTYSLREEQDAVGWLHQEVATGGELPLMEAYGVVRSLSLAMHGGQAMVLPLLQLKEFDQYTTTHSMNVAVLAMALGEFLELGGATVRALGVAGLLHDLGKVCIPKDILIKPGKLTESERDVIREHPVVGARMLLASPDPMDLAAVVAYEHHIMLDGGGYPSLHDARGAQYASRLVHICDVYDALRTKRPYRQAWESERTIAYIEGRAGVEFDPAIARSFTAMMRKWDHRIAMVPV
jgi:putative nucleotidyltransferase with HDIG domain